MRNLGPTELAEHLKSSNPLLLDVREPWEFAICHIADSQLLPMSQIPARYNELDPEQEIVLICHHGIRSRQVGLYLEHLGFCKLINLQQGVDGWAREVDPDMAVY